MNEIQITNSQDFLPTSTKIEEVFTKRNLVQLTKDYSKGEIITVIAFLTQKYLSAFNIAKPMTAEQILLFAEDFYETYYTDTLDDLKLMFKEVRLGNIGTIYNRIDGQVIFEWYRVYLEMKYEAREKLIREQKDENANVLNGLSKSEKLQKLVDRYRINPKVEKENDNALTFNSWKDTLPYFTDQQLEAQLKEFTDRSLLSGAYQSHIIALQEEKEKRNA